MILSCFVFLLKNKKSVYLSGGQLVGWLVIQLFHLVAHWVEIKLNQIKLNQIKIVLIVLCFVFLKKKQICLPFWWPVCWLVIQIFHLVGHWVDRGILAKANHCAVLNTDLSFKEGCGEKTSLTKLEDALVKCYRKSLKLIFIQLIHPIHSTGADWCWLDRLGSYCYRNWNRYPAKKNIC